MGKTSILLVVGVAVGVFLGASHALYDLGVIFAGVETTSVLPELPDTTEHGVPLVDEDLPQPRIEVKNSRHEFGRMGAGNYGEAEFVIRSVGDESLVLKPGKATCKCTEFSVEKTLLAPGEETTVYVKWRADGDPGPFRQSAPVYTNDRGQPVVDFVIHGIIDRMIEYVPRDFNLGRFAIDESASATVKMYGFGNEPIKVLQHEFLGRSAHESFDFSYEKIEPDLAAYPEAKSGLLLRVSLKPGLPLGAIDQQLQVMTNLDHEVPVFFRISGELTSDVTIVGDGSWSPSRGILKAGIVDSDEGFTKRLRIIVRGEHRDDTSFEIVGVEPGVLQAELGEESQPDGVAVKYVPLTISVPPGAKPASHLGAGNDEPAGKVMLKSTHPKVPDIQIVVQFAIER